MVHLLQTGQDVFDFEAGGAGAGDELAHDLIQLALPLDVVALHFLRADERSRSLMGFDNTEDFQFPVGADNGVGVDGEIDGGLANGGQLVAGMEGIESDAVSNLLDKLAVDGDAASEVEPEGEGDRFGLRGRHLEL